MSLKSFKQITENSIDDWMWNEKKNHKLRTSNRFTNSLKKFPTYSGLSTRVGSLSDREAKSLQSGRKKNKIEGGNISHLGKGIIQYNAHSSFGQRNATHVGPARAYAIGDKGIGRKPTFFISHLKNQPNISSAYDHNPKSSAQQAHDPDEVVVKKGTRFKIHSVKPIKFKASEFEGDDGPEHDGYVVRMRQLESFKQITESRIPKVGMQFLHKRVLDSKTNKPAQYEVTKIAKGLVYYKQPEEKKAKEYTSLEDFHKIIKESFNRGDRVQRKANIRHIGTVYQVSHGRDGSFANVKWDNGWKESKLGFHELLPHKGEPLPDNQNQLIGLLKKLHKNK